MISEAPKQDDIQGALQIIFKKSGGYILEIRCDDVLRSTIIYALMRTIHEELEKAKEEDKE